MKTVYYFSGANCVKCKTVKKFWNEIVAVNTGFEFKEEDTDKSLALAAQYKVMALPTFLVVEVGVEKARISGEVSKKILQDFLDKNK